MGVEQRAQVEGVAAFLAESDLFAGLDETAHARLAGAWEAVHVRGGEVVIHAGDPGDAVYLVVSGRLRVTTERADGPSALSEIGRGQIVGEMALIDDAPRNASVHAIRDSELLRLGADHFRSVIEEEPGVLLAISRLLVDRLRITTTHGQMRSTVRTLAIVSAGPTVQAGGFARRLAAQLGTAVPPPIVDERTIAERFGRVDPDDHAGFDRELRAWLQGLEVDNPYVVYVSEEGDGPWAERCVRQADRVLLVGDADAEARSARAARDTVTRVAGQVPVDLVLLHPPDRVRPRHTSQWLDDRTYAAHHHVRRGRATDHGRVARLLTGRGVGLTLSGGGPRGFAHIGAMRAFDEVGLPIDYVGGTSIGALMGALLGMGFDQPDLEHRVLEAFTRSGRVVDRTFPIVALSSARRLETLLQDDRFFGDVDLEDLWLPCFAVSANLTRATLVVDDRGPAWQAIRASISLPGIMPAVCRDGDLLVDGGIMNNLPIDIMSERIDSGVHLAIDLEPAVDLQVRQSFPSALSGWSVAAQRLNPFTVSPTIPGPLEVLLRSRAVSSRSALSAKLDTIAVDLYLAPPVEQCGLLDFTVAPDLIERGYRYTLDQLENVDARVQSAIVGCGAPT